MEGIKQITIEDKNYPDALRKIPNAPKVLYYRGILPVKKEQCFAVVGTRRPSEYGQEATIQITGGLVDSGLTIVSGLAPGIDTFAHRTCVEKGARTIAVLGSGLSEKSMYPQQNVHLSREILKHGGCLISEYDTTDPGYKSNFPERNRIVSALSLGALVVEAKEKSGSLITARLAILHGKKLFAVPGPIYTQNAKGPNKLIKAGATLVESAQDILDVLGIELAPRSLGEAGAENKEEQLIIDALIEGSLYIDKIIEKTKLSAAAVASHLALMEIKGTIRSLGANTYALP